MRTAPARDRLHAAIVALALCSTSVSMVSMAGALIANPLIAHASNDEASITGQARPVGADRHAHHAAAAPGVDASRAEFKAVEHPAAEHPAAEHLAAASQSADVCGGTEVKAAL